jgi:hypothetical protein
MGQQIAELKAGDVIGLVQTPEKGRRTENGDIRRR